jgi:hypothetical protein
MKGDGSETDISGHVGEGRSVGKREGGGHTGGHGLNRFDIANEDFESVHKLSNVSQSVLSG